MQDNKDNSILVAFRKEVRDFKENGIPRPIRKEIIPTIPAPEYCFSCGEHISQEDYHLFHYFSNALQESGEPYLYSMRVTTEELLSKTYTRNCCNTMLQGDPLEYRQYMALYDPERVNEHVKF